MNQTHQAIVNYLFEAGILNKTPRSGFWFLGSGEQSVAEHIHRMQHICFALAHLAGLDPGKMLAMSLFHDFAEGRTSDLNYVHQKYVKSDEHAAVEDFVKTIPFGETVKTIIDEYEARESRESLLVKDADNLELLLSLKEQQDIGNERAKTWIPSLLMRLKTEEGKALAQAIVVTDSDAWWFSSKDKQDEWWIHRNGKNNKKDVGA